MSEQIVFRLVPMARWLDKQGCVASDWCRIGELEDHENVDIGWSVIRAMFVNGVDIMPRTIKCIRVVEASDGHE